MLRHLACCVWVPACAGRRLFLMQHERTLSMGPRVRGDDGVAGAPSSETVYNCSNTPAMRFLVTLSHENTWPFIAT
jgi:hypothetical protein